MFKKDSILLYSFGGVTLIITAWSSGIIPRRSGKATRTSSGKLWQRSLVPTKLARYRGLQQIWVEDLNRVDRCITCHQGLEWKGLISAAQPFKSHPQEILKKHPLNEYGCTVCHGGQGFATDMESAHGFVKHWDEPLMGKQVSDLYLVKDRRAMMQMNCNACHRYDRETKGADFINQAKQLVRIRTAEPAIR